jgi:valyl-tRNA synthetase
MPDADPSRVDPASESRVGDAIEAIRAVRNWRESIDARPGLFIAAVKPAAEDLAPLIAHMARLEWSEGPRVATVPTPLGAVEILATEGLDLGAAERKVEEERARLDKEIARAEGKLGNAGFAAKAPPAVVEGERAKLERLRAERDAL